jgi:hypothetical protein
VTTLLCIDTELNRVRRYHARRASGRPLLTDECSIVRPQCDTLAEQLESLRAGRPMEYVQVEPTAA